MKITSTTIEIECNADELRQSNDLCDAFSGMLRRCFNGPVRYNTENVSEEEISDED